MVQSETLVNHHFQQINISVLIRAICATALQERYMLRIQVCLSEVGVMQ